MHLRACNIRLAPSLPSNFHILKILFSQTLLSISVGFDSLEVALQFANYQPASYQPENAALCYTLVAAFYFCF